MGKYEALGSYLSKLRKESEFLSFTEIEKILGFPLPDSARAYRAWWANDKTHVQAMDGWLSSGWKVDSVDLNEEVVAFSKCSEKRYGNQKIQHKKESLKQITEVFSPKSFEEFARHHMSHFFKKDLMPRKKKEWPKLFDLVSEDFEIVGDAKYMSLVRGKYLPPAKFSVIAEHVWMLEKIDASIKFLVFGNDKRVPQEWLKRYGKFAKSVRFYFLDKRGNITRLDKIENIPK